MRLRRKQGDPVGEDVAGPIGDVAGESDGPRGPIDASELDPDAAYVDLGSLLVQPPDGLDLRLQVDEETGTVMTVLLVADEGVLEMRAFASSRGGDLWTEARREIAADTTRRGGTATEQDGSFGPELLCQVPVTGPNGESLTQPSRVIGHTGPRWFLRATMAGRPAFDAEYAEPFETALRNVAVRRGNEAMAPGEALPLRMPPQATPLAE
ncbi:hypothetical protein ACVW00_002344 [Marmoricola sp. URHA0025 HA25]